MSPIWKWPRPCTPYAAHAFSPVIRGNVSEIQSLAGKDAQTKGVDAGTTSGLDEAAATAKALALREKCIVIISGAKDIITDGNTTILITNGCPEMAQITGSGS